jgi:hypothetical protein
MILRRQSHYTIRGGKNALTKLRGSGCAKEDLNREVFKVFWLSPPSPAALDALHSIFRMFTALEKH